MVTKDRPRAGSEVRNTREAQIHAEILLDEPRVENPPNVPTTYPVSFTADYHEVGIDLWLLAHMIAQFFRLGEFGGQIVAHGDSIHHVTEDALIALGKALLKALGDRKGIRRVANLQMPMEGTLVTVAVDISGRGDATIDFRDMDNKALAGMAQHMLMVLAKHGGFDLYCKVETIGEFAIRSDHHKLETLGKALGVVLHDATRITREDIPSIKGNLAA